MQFIFAPCRQINSWFLQQFISVLLTLCAQMCIDENGLHVNPLLIHQSSCVRMCLCNACVCSPPWAALIPLGHYALEPKSKRQNKLVAVKSPANCCLGNLCLLSHLKINLIGELCLAQQHSSLLFFPHQQPITFTQCETGLNKGKDGWGNEWFLSFIDHCVLSLSMFCSFVSLCVCLQCVPV